MCGITGFIDPLRQLKAENLSHILKDMCNSLTHRGPDESGLFVDKSLALGLGHRRLSVLDVSRAGNQPMTSNCGRYTIVYNGEIYNYKDLQRRLVREDPSINFKTKSDTEVLLNAISAWGFRKAICAFNGMFAFALWDRQKQKLVLAKDRLGEKPLYFGFQKNIFMFSSEIKALKKNPLWDGAVDRDALAKFLSLGYVPAPSSIYDGISKLAPGHYLEIDYISDRKTIKVSDPFVYWDIHKKAHESLISPYNGGIAEAITKTERILKKSVEQRMLSDVSLGAFLSGGLDSSTIVTIAQELSPKPLKTFTIGFEKAEFNEAGQARELSDYLGTEHTELYVNEEQLLSTISKLPTLFDEPFGDSSQIPTYLISELARRDVTVVLSGDGGDELFCGYKRYDLCHDLWRFMRLVPKEIRKGFGGRVKKISMDNWDLAGGWVSKAASKYGRMTSIGQKVHKLAGAIEMPNPEALYKYIMQSDGDSASFVKGLSSSRVEVLSEIKWPQSGTYKDRMMLFDQQTYLPNDILVKVDRASMGVSLESRVPFLDHELVEWAWSIPTSIKVKDGKNKWILRQIAEKRLPRSFVDRPKKGFSIPIDDWIRGPLRNWGSELLSKDKLEKEGFLNVDAILVRWAEHCEGKRNWGTFLWNVLIFESWLEDQ